MPEYSVVIPVYNSYESLGELFSLIEATMNGIGKTFEVIFVDDDSLDKSWEKIIQLHEKDPERITAIRLAKNFGQHNATVCGIARARGRYIITMDDDLQNPPSEIPKLIAAMQETDADLVYGISNVKRHSVVRNMGSSALKVSSRHLLKRKGKGSSFRLLKSSVAKSLLNHQLNFIFIDELFNWYTNHIEFVPVEHHKRKYQSSNYSSHSLFSMFSNLVIYYTAIPLRMMVVGGLITSFLSLLAGIFFLYRKIIHDVPLGYTSLIVAILFSTSVILLSLGVIGEYLRRIYMVQNHKPPFAIKNLLNHETS